MNRLRYYSTIFLSLSTITIIIPTTVTALDESDSREITHVTISDPSMSFRPTFRPFTYNNAESMGSDYGNPGSKGGFWLTTELLRVDFRKGCLSTGLCYEPKFKLLNTMTVNGEQAVISWPAAGATELVEDQTHSFVTYWTVGEPEDVALSCQIAGRDPSFGFSRVCDETPAKRVFNEAAIQKTLSGNYQWRAALSNEPTTSATPSSQPSRMIVELRARCFNATLAVRKHVKRCPWCPNPDTHIVISGQQTSDKEDAALGQQQKSAADAIFFHNLLLIALSGAIVFGVSGCCCAIAMHWRYYRKRARSRKAVNIALGSSAGATIGTTGGKPSGGAKRLLKFAPLPSEQKELVRYRESKPLSRFRTENGECENVRGGCPGVVTVGSATALSPPMARKFFEAHVFAPSEIRYDMPWDKKFRGLASNFAESNNYQTLTLNNCNNNNTVYDASAVCHYDVHGGLSSHTVPQNVSGSSIREACESSTGSGNSNASTSATTIGYGSLNGLQVTPDSATIVSSANGGANVIHHAAFSTQCQNECNGYLCGNGTLSRHQRQQQPAPYSQCNNINSNSYGNSCHYYGIGGTPQPPAAPPPIAPRAAAASAAARHDDSGMDSI